MALFFINDLSKAEILNDIYGDIVNLYRMVKHHPEELHKQRKWMICNRQNWEGLQATPIETISDVQLAARFLYLQKQAFGSKVAGQTFGTCTTHRPRLNIFTMEQDLADAHYRLASATIESPDWESIIKKYDRLHTLFYCDSPC